MREKRIEEKQDEDRTGGIDHRQAVLYLLLDGDFPWTVDEIAREISGSHLNATDAVSSKPELSATNATSRESPSGASNRRVGGLPHRC
jgi:hypothetical protein